MICKAFLERNFSAEMSDMAKGSWLLLSHLVGEEKLCWVRARCEPQPHEQPDPACLGALRG